VIISAIIDFFFPLHCAVCGSVLNKDTCIDNLLCRNCLKKLPETINTLLLDKHCSICSRLLVSEIKVCTSCRNRKYSFEKNISIWNYHNFYIKKIIHCYKFKNNKNAAVFFARYIFYIYSCYFTGIPVVPAPCSIKRLKKYGWDHMKLITSILSKKNNLEIFYLFKKKKTHDQKELDYDQRQKELKNRIILLKRNAEKCLREYDTILLLDDVFTTGATANHCSELLLRFGFKKIIILTIALD